MKLDQIIEREDRNCLGMDPNLFFTPEGMCGTLARQYNERAKRLCRGCPIFWECRRFALETEQIGVWGGTDNVERDKIRVRLALEAVG